MPDNRQLCIEVRLADLPPIRELIESCTQTLLAKDQALSLVGHLLHPDDATREGCNETGCVLIREAAAIRPVIPGDALAPPEASP